MSVNRGMKITFAVHLFVKRTAKLQKFFLLSIFKVLLPLRQLCCG